MAVKFKYSYSADQLEFILTVAISSLVRDDLERFELRPQSSLYYLFSERGFGHEAGFEIDAYPAEKSSPVLFYIVQGEIFGCSEGGIDVAIFSPSEIRNAVRDELKKQVLENENYLPHAEELVKMIGLNDV